MAYPQERCIHELFEDQVRQTPDAVALVFGDERLSYGELNARANRLARHLRGLGVRPDDRVAICVERSVEMIVGLLGVLKAGGAYVPLDPAYPVERLAYMLADSGPMAVLTHGAAREALAAAGEDRPIVDLEADAAGWAELTGDDPARGRLTSRHLAYVIYTSGSTGQPKGVMVEHRNLVNQITALQCRYQLSREDRVLQFARFAFDMSVEEITPRNFASQALKADGENYRCRSSTPLRGRGTGLRLEDDGGRVNGLDAGGENTPLRGPRNGSLQVLYPPRRAKNGTRVEGRSEWALGIS